VFAYRVLLSLFATVTLIKAARAGQLAARLGRETAQPGPHIWLHGASNGELTSVRPVLEQVIAARPDLNWLITTNTTTAQTMVEGWNLPQISTRLAPVDLSHVQSRMMRSWDVRAHIALESELWPNRFRLCPGPVLLLGARLSESTARAWSKLGDLAQRALAPVVYASAQDSASLARFDELGLSKDAQGPVVDLKSFYKPPSATGDGTDFSGFPRATTWLAASTHDGEEEIVLAAHLKALETQPELKLILAPRHPNRGDAIADMIEAAGLRFARRSAGEPPADTQVYLADTLGEMHLWYPRAGRVYVGGGLTDRGGHTPYEPAAFEAALIFGADTKNFRASYDRLRASDAAVEVTGVESLAQALTDLEPVDVQLKNGALAIDALKQDGDISDLIRSLLKHLPKV